MTPLPEQSPDAGQSGDWKNAHANASGPAMEHPLVVRAMEEFAGNMGFDFEGLPRYGLMKIAMYAAQVARAQALGFDPDLLRLSDEESETQQLALARAAVALGKPTWVIRSDDIQRID